MSQKRLLALLQSLYEYSMSRPLEWEAQLFKNMRVCALVPQAHSDMKLLDVLVKKHTSGDVIIVGRTGPLGAMGCLDSDSERRVAKGLQLLKEKASSEDGDDFEKGLHLSVITFDVSSSSSFLARILGSKLATAKAQLQAENTFTCEIEQVRFEKVEQDFLNGLFTSDNPSWEPNVKKLEEFKWPKDRWSGKRELWVVSQIFYCSKISISANRSRTVGGALQVSGEGSGAVSPVGVELNVSQTKTGSWEVTAPKVNGKVRPFAFAFQAVHLRYGKDGKKLPRGHVEDGVGKKRLERRAGATSTLDSLNPDDDPDYHMGGLFVQSPDEVQSWEPTYILRIITDIRGFEDIKPVDESGDVV